MSDAKKLEKAIATLEAQRSALGNTVVDTATAGMREKLAALSSQDGDKRQLVSVLFADVSGFTNLSERLDPEDVQELLKRLWPALDRIIVRNRGHIDKHIGDAVMAVWGLTGAKPEDAQSAVRAGLAMQRELVAFRQREGVELAMRVGINTGQASVSKVASTGEWNVIGDVVNVASRLEHAAELGSVLVGKATGMQVEGAFELAAQPPLAVKGKIDPLETFVVLGQTAQVVRLPSHTLADVAAAFVGREDELGRLLAQYREVLQGHARSICVSAEGGIGKSRLLAELSRLLRMQGDPLQCLEHACGDGASSEPFSTLRGLITKLVGITTREPDQVRATLSARYADLGEPASDEAARYVGFVLGLLDETPDLAALRHDAGQIRGRAEVLLLRLLQHGARQRVIVVLLEDIQHADDASLEFLGRVAAVDQRLLLVATSRPDLWTRSAAPGAWMQRMQLQPLGRVDAYELARRLLQTIPDAPPWLSDFLVEHSGGNPFYCEEILRTLVERNVIAQSAGGWVAPDAPPAEFRLPARLTPLLAERLDRLPADARALLERAAVIGQRVGRVELEVLSGGELSESAMQRLSDANMLAASEFSMGTPPGFAFVHALCWEVTYEFTLLKTRRELHGRLAAHLETQAGSTDAEIARHWEAAGQHARAAEFYTNAGERARRADATELAKRFFQKAATLAPEDRALAVRCHFGLGEVWMRQTQFAEALSAYETMYAAAVTLGDPVAQARAQNGLSWAASQANRFAEATRYAERAAEVACSTVEAARNAELRRDAEVEVAAAWHNLGWAQVMLSDADQAIAAAQEGLGAAEAAHAVREQALCLNLIGVALYHVQGRYDEAARYMEQALALYRRLGDRWGVSCQLNNLGDLARLRRDYLAAAGLLEEALEVARSIGHSTQELAVLGNLGATYNALGQFGRAETALTRALALASESEPFSLAACHAYMCEALLGKHEVDAALAHGVSAVRVAGGTDTAFRGEAFRALGRAVGAAAVSDTGAHADVDGKRLDAEACFARSVATFHALGLQPQRAETYLAWAEYEAARGDGARSAELKAEANSLRAALTLHPR
jgi:class 3 adenylate cyclase/predicted ATPase